MFWNKILVKYFSFYTQSCVCLCVDSQTPPGSGPKSWQMEKFRRNLQPKTSLLSDFLVRKTRPSYQTKNEFVSAGRVGFGISIEIFVEDLQNRVSHQFDLQGTASCITLHATKDVERCRTSCSKIRVNLNVKSGAQRDFADNIGLIVGVNFYDCSHETLPNAEMTQATIQLLKCNKPHFQNLDLLCCKTNTNSTRKHT